MIHFTTITLLLLSTVSSFTSSHFPHHHSTHLHTLQSIVEKDGLFWPSTQTTLNNPDSPTHDYDEEAQLLSRTLDSVLKIHTIHSEPDYLIPWQKRHQTTSTSSGFILTIPGIGVRVITNAHSVEYGSVVQVQRRGEDEKYEGVIEAVGNECDLAILRVDGLLGDDGTTDTDRNEEDRIESIALELGPLPSLQEEVEVLGYPSGGESLCVTKGVVSRIETQEYAQAGSRLLAMQIDAAINPGECLWKKMLCLLICAFCCSLYSY